MSGKLFRLEKILTALSKSGTPFRQITPAQVLVVGFAGIILIGTLLLSLPVASSSAMPTGFVDAFFTATSAVCVTGLVAVDTGTYWSLFGQLVILSLIQIGGVGFMALSTMVALFFGRKIGLRSRILIQESLGQLSLEGMVRLILAVLAVTLFFEGIGCAILGTYFSREFGLAKGMYYGLFHSISAFCNAGFDLFGGFKILTVFAAVPLVLIIICLLLFFGGLGFSVIMDLFHLRRHRHLSLHSRLVLIITSILLIVGTGVFLLLEHNNPHTLGPKSFGEKLLNAWFGAASPRTAGFNTVALGQLRQATLFFVIILMFIGASPGSTGGGIKTTTFGIAVTSLWGKITGKDSLVVFKRTLPIIDSIKAFCVIFAALILITAVTFILTLTENAGFLPLLFEVTSAFGTVGLTTGITTSLSSVGKLILACTMFAGRLGPLTLATALSIRHRGPEAVHYPEERVGIG